MPPRLDILKQALETLAADADEQLDALRKQGCVPPEYYIDELALDYDAIAAAAGAMLEDGELDTGMCRCVQELNAYLDTISGQQNAELWTADALRSAEQWRVVRAKAKRCLTLLSSK